MPLARAPRARILAVVGERILIIDDERSVHDVARAYLELAERFPERFVVIEADRSPDEVHREVVGTYEGRVEKEERPAPIPPDFTPKPGAPR